MHQWGDKDVDWNGITEAGYFIGDFLKRWGRMHVTDVKEKYGTLRVYCNFGWSCLLNITHPAYQHYGPYPKWLMKLDIYHLSKVIPYLNYVVFPYHKFLYRLAYKKALVKWPHLELEILCGADWQEYLGGLSSKYDELASNPGSDPEEGP